MADARRVMEADDPYGTRYQYRTVAHLFDGELADGVREGLDLARGWAASGDVATALAVGAFAMMQANLRGDHAGALDDFDGFAALAAHRASLGATYLWAQRARALAGQGDREGARAAANRVAPVAAELAGAGAAPAQYEVALGWVDLTAVDDARAATVAESAAGRSAELGEPAVEVEVEALRLLAAATASTDPIDRALAVVDRAGMGAGWRTLLLRERSRWRSGWSPWRRRART